MMEPVKKSGLAKAATLFAIGLGISLGLCGANFVLISSGYGGQFMSGSPSQTALQRLVMGTAWLELAGIVLCSAGLLVVSFIALFRSIFYRNPGDPQ